MTEIPLAPEETPVEGPKRPSAVEPGQMWRDTDTRSKGSGEFIVLLVWEGKHFATHGRASEPDRDRAQTLAQRAVDRGATDYFAVVRRKGGTMTRIRLDRLTGERARGYEYMGRAR